MLTENVNWKLIENDKGTYSVIEQVCWATSKFVVHMDPSSSFINIPVGDILLEILTWPLLWKKYMYTLWVYLKLEHCAMTCLSQINSK